MSLRQWRDVPDLELDCRIVVAAHRLRQERSADGALAEIIKLVLDKAQRNAALASTTDSLTWTCQQTTRLAALA